MWEDQAWVLHPPLNSQQVTCQTERYLSKVLWCTKWWTKYKHLSPQKRPTHLIPCMTEQSLNIGDKLLTCLEIMCKEHCIWSCQWTVGSCLAVLLPACNALPHSWNCFKSTLISGQIKCLSCELILMGSQYRAWAPASNFNGAVSLLTDKQFLIKTYPCRRTCEVGCSIAQENLRATSRHSTLGWWSVCPSPCCARLELASFQLQLHHPLQHCRLWSKWLPHSNPAWKVLVAI